MATKIDQIVSYIEKLEIGSKISIKSLAQKLDVSEGTAYHGIKRAEQMSLVVTLPKAGTTRIKPKKTKKAHSVSLSILETLADAEIAVAAGGGDVTVQRFIVADGSESELRNMLKSGETGVLCIVGDRGEMQRIALSSGAHLLLTSGARPDAETLRVARKSGLAVLQTKLTAFHVLNILNADRGICFPNISLLNVKDLMQPAQFLYQGDIAADARQIYKNCGITEIPVVDEQGNFAGMLDTAEAFDAELSQHISRLYNPKSTEYVIPTTGTMSDVIGMMIETGTNVVFIVNGARLEGMVTSADVIKASRTYYISETGEAYGFHMEAVDNQCDSEKRVYSIHILNRNDESDAVAIPFALQYIFSAFGQYCREKSLKAAIISESTLMNRAEELSGKLFISVEALSGMDHGAAVFECKVYGSGEAYLKTTLITKLK